jgi:uncharacterized membrane protein
MTTNSLHLLSAYLPVWIIIVGGILALAGFLLKNESYFRISFWFICLGVVASLFTGAMGGASMSETRILPGIDNASLHSHAWTSAIAITFFIISAWLFIRRRRFLKSGKEVRNLNIYLFLALAGVAAFLFWTIRIAHQIRL